jgi:hypothetical protein
MKQTKRAFVVYAVTLLGRMPFLVRDECEVDFLSDQLVGSGYGVVVVEVELPIGFRGWHYPKPLRNEPSVN